MLLQIKGKVILIKPGRTWEVNKIKILPLSGMAIPLNIYNLYANKN